MLLEIYNITQRLAEANKTLLEMNPPRFCGDNKPANICKWSGFDGQKEDFYLLDTDEIPTITEMEEGGGPRCYATFQLAGKDFTYSPTLMVLYSWMATIAAFCSRENMIWVYTNTCHTQTHLPHTSQALLNATKCPPKIERILMEAGALLNSDLNIATLISFFEYVQRESCDTNPLKRRRVSVA